MPNYLKLVKPVSRKLSDQLEMARNVRQIDPRWQKPMSVPDFMLSLTDKEYQEMLSWPEGETLDDIVRAFAASRAPGLKFIDPPPAGPRQEYMIVDDDGSSKGWESNFPGPKRVK